MNNPLPLFFSSLAGLGIGFIFYGGLWLTVSRIVSAPRPGLLLAASFILRTAFALAAIWWVSQGSGARIALCLLGFIAARPLVFRLTRALPSAVSKTGEEPRCT